MSDPTRARVFDKDWKYVKYEDSDIRKTFARIRRQQKEAEAAKKAAPNTVRPLRKKGTP